MRLLIISVSERELKSSEFQTHWQKMHTRRPFSHSKKGQTSFALRFFLLPAGLADFFVLWGPARGLLLHLPGLHVGVVCLEEVICSGVVLERPEGATWWAAGGSPKTSLKSSCVSSSSELLESEDEEGVWERGTAVWRRDEPKILFSAVSGVPGKLKRTCFAGRLRDGVTGTGGPSSSMTSSTVACLHCRPEGTTGSGWWDSLEPVALPNCWVADGAIVWLAPVISLNKLHNLK